MKYILGLTLAILLFLPMAGKAGVGDTTEVVIFTSTGCPFCAKTLAHFEEIQKNKTFDIKVVDYDVRKQPEEIKRFMDYAFVYNVSTDHVPMTFIGQTAIQGFQPEAIDEALAYCKQNECQKASDYMVESLKIKPRPADGNTQTETGGQAKTIGWVLIGVLLVGGVVMIWANR